MREKQCLREREGGEREWRESEKVREIKRERVADRKRVVMKEKN